MLFMKNGIINIKYKKDAEQVSLKSTKILNSHM